MPKYLLKVSYTADGVRGVLKEGGSARRDVAGQLIKSLGGEMESFYFAFGTNDFYVISELPDAATAAAVSLTVGASGAASSHTVVLVTPEEIDAATKKSVDYRPPGA